MIGRGTPSMAMRMKAVHEVRVEVDDPGKEVGVVGGRMEAQQMVILTGTTNSNRGIVRVLDEKGVKKVR